MQSIQISHHYRPLRIAYGVKVSETGQLIRAAELATVSWGGKYNPIIPMDANEPNVKQLLNYFNVDTIENISGSSAPQFINDDACLKWPDLVRKTTLNNEQSMGFVNVLDVSHNMRRLYDEVFSKQDAKSNCLLPRWDDDDPRAAYFSIAFGKYPHFKDADYSKGFEYYLKAKTHDIAVEDAELKANLFTAYTPILLSGDELMLRSNGFHDDYQGFYVGLADNPYDLINFWNIRAAARNVIFVPYNQSGILLAKKIIERRNKNKSKRQEPIKGMRPDASAFWYRTELGQQDVEAFARQVNNQVIMLPIHDELWDGSYMSSAAYPVFEEDSYIVGQLEGEKDGERLVIARPKPPTYKAQSFVRQLIVSVIHPLTPLEDGKSLVLPPYKPIAEWASRKLTLSTSGVRLKHGQLDMIIDTRDLVEHLFLVRDGDLIRQIFKVAGITAKPSNPGILADRLVEQMDSLESCRVFKVRGVRKTLKNMKVTDTKSFSNIRDIIIDKDESGVSSFQNFKDLHIEARETAHLSPQDCFDYLIAKNILKAGYKPICPNCKLDFWVDLNQTSDFVKCEYCFGEVSLALQLRSRGDVAYRRSGLFGRDNNLEGGLPVALTLLQLSRCGELREVQYATAHTLVSKSLGIKCETDLIMLGKSHEDKLTVLIGECKDSMAITQDDLDKLGKAADALEAQELSAYIIFSKINGFTDDEVAMFKKAVKSGRKLILFTEKEIEPFYPYEGYDKESGINPHPFSFQELSENSIKVYLQD